jgi:hypothetical protein
MVDHWRWHGSTRVPHGTRFSVIVGLLLACVLLAVLPTVASASAPEVAGEWTLVLQYSGGTANGTAIITEEANAKGEFAAHSVLLNGAVPGTFSGTLEGSNATVETSSVQYGPVPASKFNSSAMAVDSTDNSLSMSGSGMFTLGTETYSATLTATRVKSARQIKEQEEKEQEERAARMNIRGEWSITLEGDGQTLKGTALVTDEATSENIFASKSAAFETGLIGGSFGGTLKGDEAEVTITTDEVPGTVPPGTFTGEKIVVSSKANPTSMTGTGTSKYGPVEFTSTLTATRIKSYQQVKEQETKEREATEKQEKEAQEATEKAEAEAKAKGERETAEKREREAREAVEKATKILPTTIVPPVTVTPLVSALLATNTLTVGKSAAISLKLTNPNSSSVSGQVKLTYTALAKIGKGSSAKHTASSKTSTLGDASFSISSKGSESIKVKLSHAGLTELTRHKTLHVVVTITTQASDQPSTSKTFSLTLHAAKAASRKH